MDINSCTFLCNIVEDYVDVYVLLFHFRCEYTKINNDINCEKEKIINDYIENTALFFMENGIKIDEDMIDDMKNNRYSIKFNHISKHNSIVYITTLG